MLWSDPLRHSGESRNPVVIKYKKLPALAGMTLLFVFLSACGFEPLLAQKGAADQSVVMLYPGIEIGNIPDRDGQYLRNLLIDRLYTNGRPYEAPYILTFSPLVKSSVNLGIRKNASATRAQMQITTEMQLMARDTKQILLTRSLKTTGAYNLLDNQLATLTSQQYTLDDALKELGDEAVTELNLFFSRHIKPS